MSFLAQTGGWEQYLNQRRHGHRAGILGQSVDQSAQIISSAIAQRSEHLAREIGNVSRLNDESFAELVCGLHGLREQANATQVTMEAGFDRVASALQALDHSVHDLIDINEELLEVVSSPVRTQAYEHYEIATDAFVRGHFEEAIKSLNMAISGGLNQQGYRLEWRFYELRAIARIAISDEQSARLEIRDDFEAAIRYATDKATKFKLSLSLFDWLLSAGNIAAAEDVLENHCREAAGPIRDMRAEVSLRSARLAVAQGDLVKAREKLESALKGTTRTTLLIVAAAETSFTEVIGVVEKAAVRKKRSLTQKVERALEQLQSNKEREMAGTEIAAEIKRRGLDDLLGVDPAGRLNLRDEGVAAASLCDLINFLESEVPRLEHFADFAVPKRKSPPPSATRDVEELLDAALAGVADDSDERAARSEFAASDFDQSNALSTQHRDEFDEPQDFVTRFILIMVTMFFVILVLATMFVSN